MTEPPINARDVLGPLGEQTLWIAGQEVGELWVLVGVFDSRDKAVAACTTRSHFVGTVTLNETAPEQPTELPNWFFPLDKAVA